MKSAAVIVSIICALGLMGCARQAAIATSPPNGGAQGSIASPREATIGQQSGRIRGQELGAATRGLKPAGGADAWQRSAPVSCSQQNATDPACHAASQQSRPPTR